MAEMMFVRDTTYGADEERPPSVSGEGAERMRGGWGLQSPACLRPHPDRFAIDPPLKGRETRARFAAPLILSLVLGITAFAALAAALHFPELTGRVVDQANVLPA